MHRGIKDTLTELRLRYWIPKGRQEEGTISVFHLLKGITESRDFSTNALNETF